MAKPYIDLRDGNMSSVHKMFYERPEFIWATQGRYSDVIVLSDFAVNFVSDCRRAGYSKIIAYIMEPRIIHPFVYAYVENQIDQFDLVMTFDQYLLETYPEKCRFVHAVGSGDLWTQAISPKTKLCSIMTGSAVTEGHKLRLAAREIYKDFFDGSKGYDSPKARWRDPWISDFCFSVAIENSRQAHYFSEKIIHLFRSGTIPIYWGCPTIDQFFDPEGIFVFETLEELGEILKTLSFEEYEKRLPAVQRNFKIAERYPQNYMINHPEFSDALDVIWPHIRHYFP